jgi:flavin reductase (DIM6/NTAB) family NADH-FMN oxidoreductase RutF
MTATLLDSVAENAASFDSRSFRDALSHFATGVAVITAPGLTPDEAPVGVTVNSFTAISLDPPLVLFSAARKLHSLPALLAARHYGINLLNGEQESLSARFAKADTSKWDGVKAEAGKQVECALIPGTLAHFECVPHATFDGGDHMVFLVRVVRFAVDLACAPLVFFRGAYCRLEPPSNLRDQP